MYILRLCVGGRRRRRAPMPGNSVSSGLVAVALAALTADALAVAMDSIIFCTAIVNRIARCCCRPRLLFLWLREVPATARESAESLPNLSAPLTSPPRTSSKDACPLTYKFIICLRDRRRAGAGSPTAGEASIGRRRRASSAASPTSSASASSASASAASFASPSASRAGSVAGASGAAAATRAVCA